MPGINIPAISPLLDRIILDVNSHLTRIPEPSDTVDRLSIETAYLDKMENLINGTDKTEQV